mmetsp:Transcript_19277/g.50092  ORF Transcript_19277/g.50092 Transcript_19277/m.50092 type:complete len:343 (+) Transcript_19277:236-1264(+)
MIFHGRHPSQSQAFIRKRSVTKPTYSRHATPAILASSRHPWVGTLVNFSTPRHRRSLSSSESVSGMSGMSAGSSCGHHIVRCASVRSREIKPPHRMHTTKSPPSIAFLSIPLWPASLSADGRDSISSRIASAAASVDASASVMFGFSRITRARSEAALLLAASRARPIASRSPPFEALTAANANPRAPSASPASRRALAASTRAARSSGLMTPSSSPTAAAAAAADSAAWPLPCPSPLAGIAIAPMLVLVLAPPPTRGSTERCSRGSQPCFPVTVLVTPRHIHSPRVVRMQRVSATRTANGRDAPPTKTASCIKWEPSATLHPTLQARRTPLARLFLAAVRK